MTGEGLSMSWLVILTYTWQNSWTFSHRASIKRRHTVISSTTQGLKWMGGKTPKKDGEEKVPRRKKYSWHQKSSHTKFISVASHLCIDSLRGSHSDFLFRRCSSCGDQAYSKKCKAWRMVTDGLQRVLEKEMAVESKLSGRCTLEALE